MLKQYSTVSPFIEGGFMVSMGCGSPPSTHRGAECTAFELVFDWLSYTLPDGYDVGQCLPGYERLDWVELPFGRYGYQSARKCGNITVYSNGKKGMGTHVVMTGQGCREYGEYISEDWRGYLLYLLTLGARIVRLDVALDDFTGVATVERVIAALEAHEYSSVWRNWHPMGGGMKNGRRTGKTVYIGSPESDFYLCVYDKAAEQASKGKLGLIDCGGRENTSTGDSAASSEVWTRFELRAKDGRATDLAWRIARAGAEDVGQVVAGILRGHLEFKVPEVGDSNRRRWKCAEWWEAVLHGAAKARLVARVVKRTLEDIKRWLERQVAPSLALVLMEQGGALDWVHELVRNGRSRWRPRHLAMLGVSYAGGVG